MNTKVYKFSLKTWITLYALLFVISLSLYVFIPPKQFRVIAFFPEATTGKIRGEEHFLPYTRDTQVRLEEFIQHIMLGPKEIWNSNIFPRSTRLIGLVTGKQSVYINLSKEAFLRNDININFLTSVDILKRNIRFNFRHIKNVYVVIEGALPYEPPYVR
ncbi:hypothetical protein WKV44_03980 [Spirochaetia bacterium 38H-sp]|uniref:GerMN domain-containing protein n=1 Tax=Rarispira pelagica TaxID=3141764 RepID=A0ABU9UAK9_9SPIR